MNEFRQMMNDSIRIGILNNVSSMKKLSMLCYKELKKYRNVPSYYKLCAISKASGMISYRGWVRFAHSKGAGSEAVKGNQTTRILLVDPEVIVIVGDIIHPTKTRQSLES